MKPLRIALKYMDIFYHEENLELLHEVLDRNLIFEGPLFKFSSAEEYIDSLKQDPPKDMDYRITKSFSDKASVCLFYEFSKPGAVTTMAQMFDIESGKITRIRLVFDTVALETHEIVMASFVDEMGNDEIARMKLFSEFKTVNNHQYKSLNEETVDQLPGRYETGRLGVYNEEPNSWEDIELLEDGSIKPDSHISKWQYCSGNIIKMYYPYEAMPDFHIDAGTEENYHYVFLDNDGQSMIIVNNDGSVKSIFQRL